MFKRERKKRILENINKLWNVNVANSFLPWYQTISWGEEFNVVVWIIVDKINWNIIKWYDKKHFS